MKNKTKDCIGPLLWALFVLGVMFLITITAMGFPDSRHETLPRPTMIGVSNVGPGDILTTAFELGVESGVASWYGPGYHGKTMANGKIYNQYAMTMACNHMKLGTVVRLTNRSNGKSCIATVTDRGPHVKGRKYDCSYMVAHTLGFTKEGLATLEVEELTWEKSIC